MKEYADIDSKYRYVILASLRAKQLLRGAKPKLESQSKNLIRVAQEEVKNSLIEYEHIKIRLDEIPELDNDMFIGEKLANIKPEEKSKLKDPGKPDQSEIDKKEAPSDEEKIKSFLKTKTEKKPKVTTLADVEKKIKLKMKSSSQAKIKTDDHSSAKTDDVPKVKTKPKPTKTKEKK